MLGTFSRVVAIQFCIRINSKHAGKNMPKLYVYSKSRDHMENLRRICEYNNYRDIKEETATTYYRLDRGNSRGNDTTLVLLAV